MKFCIQCAAVALALVVGLIIGFFFLAPEVQIAALGAIERGTVAAINNAASVAAAIGTIVGIGVSLRNGHQAKERGKVLAGKIDTNTAVTIDTANAIQSAASGSVPLNADATQPVRVS